jgi:hypothetical protein
MGMGRPRRDAPTTQDTTIFENGHARFDPLSFSYQAHPLPVLLYKRNRKSLLAFHALVKSLNSIGNYSIGRESSVLGNRLSMGDLKITRLSDSLIAPFSVLR